MAESKRTFQSAKMDKDIDDRLLPAGTYRDALNVSVEFSEDGNVGALENLKGNELLANQDILGLSSSSNPNATVIGSYAHPEENKIYYFVTGDKVDGIFEYDADNGNINTIILDSSEENVIQEATFTFANAGVAGSVAQNGKITLTSQLGAVSAVTQDFDANTTASAKTLSIQARVRVPRGYANQGEYAYGTVSATQPAQTAPASVVTKTAINVTLNSATIRGEIGYNDIGVTAVGFYWGYNTEGTALTLSQLENGGAGITRNTVNISSFDDDFESNITSLPNNKLISFAAFATNTTGTGEGAVKTFTTSAAPSYNQLPNNKIFIFPAAGDAFNEGYLYPGYREFEKDNGGFYFAAVATDSSGLYANYDNLASGVTWSNTGPATLTFNNTGSYNFGKANSVNTTTTTNGVYTVTAAKSGLTSGTAQIVKGSPSGTRYKSTFTLNFAKTGTGTVPFVAAFDHALAQSSDDPPVPNPGFHWNAFPSPTAVFSIGPFEQNNTGYIMIPLSTDNTVTYVDSLSNSNTTARFNSATFDPTKVDVSITGKTEGTHYEYYIAKETMGIWGSSGVGPVPAVIIEADPYTLNGGTANVTHTLNITYNY